MTAPPPLLALEDVVKRRVSVDQHFTLEVGRLLVAPGDALALIGPSGCGKSTLIDLVALALRPDEAAGFRLAADRSCGEALDVHRLWRRDPGRLARLRARHFGYVMQAGGLLPYLSVRENVLLPQRLAGRHEPSHAEALLERLGLARLRRALPARLSVGQRQRVAVARALAHRPAIVLADEPTAALDSANAETVMTLLLELVAEAGSALLVATHDGGLVSRFGLAAVPAEMSRSGPSARTCFGREPPVPMRAAVS